MRTIGLEEHFISPDLAAYVAPSAAIAQPAVSKESSRRLLNFTGVRLQDPQAAAAAHRIAVFERSPESYPLPRAGHFDHEVMRVFPSIGIADEVEKRAIALPDYDWFNGDGQLLLHLNWDTPTPSAWKSDYMFYQPYVEDELTRAVQRHQNVSVHPGWEAVELVQRSDHVEITLHLMPPFMGQGMCSGIRDAASLAWRFDLVLRGIADPSLLDTYTSERRPHAHALIQASMDLGRIVCVADPELAAQRDQAFLTGQVPPPPPFPGLSDGILHRSASGAVGAPAGQLGVQGQRSLPGSGRSHG